MARRDKERVKPKKVSPPSDTPMSKKWEELPPVIGKDYKEKEKKNTKLSTKSYKF
tara:strand:+ start:446 stop:610 length:165 start_codon:yes stop_codon:yes gene_type:complete